MFSNASDAGRDFLPPGGSKLGTIFGVDHAKGKEDASFTYTAPKQPKKKDKGQVDSPAPTVVINSVVQAYKYVNNKYASQGTLGAALLESLPTKDYRLLLFVNRQQQVTNATITSSFLFNLQNDNYASFYDDTSQMWSIRFDTAEAIEQFAREVAMAKANSGPLSKQIQQDLSLGEGRAIEDGDSVEIKYTGWLLKDGTFGKVFDQSKGDNHFHFQVGKGKVVKGWDQGMLGMKKEGSRLLIIPPALAYGAQGFSDMIPPNSSLLIEVKVIKVNLQKVETTTPESNAPALPSITMSMQLPLPDRDEIEETVDKGRFRSASELPYHSPDSKKAKLISRVARMGQPMLPFQPAVEAATTHSEDSDDEMMAPPIAAKPPLPAKPRSLSEVGLASHVRKVRVTQTPPTRGHHFTHMVDKHHMAVSSSNEDLHQPQQPAFLQNLPGSQQLAVYHNPNSFLQQQQTALLQQQQQQQQAVLLQQQQQQQQAVLLQQQQVIQKQQQLLNQSLSATVVAPAFGASPLQAPQHPHPSSSSTADSITPVLLTESRQQNADIRLDLSKMSDKIDQILDKVESLGTSGLTGHSPKIISAFGGSMMVPSKETNVLLRNVSRIVEDTERLKQDVQEQSNKVQEQNEKIATILENRYVEQSQNLLELRNDGYKTTVSQSQARVLALEQEKIHLATELSTASSQISTLQLQLVDYKKREADLKQQLQISNANSSASKDELARLKHQKNEDDQKINNLTTKIQNDKQIMKNLESKLAGHEEELLDVKSTKNTLERSLNEKMRKSAEEKKKMETNMEELKRNYERTIEDLQEKLRKQKSSLDAEIHSKVSKAEKDISYEWQKKSDRMMAVATEKHSRQISDLKDEKNELTQKVSELEKKLTTARAASSSLEKQTSQLRDELLEMKLWKDKYGSLRTQTSAMKDRWEKKIKDVEREKLEEGKNKNEEVDKAREQRQQLQLQLQELQQEYDNQQTQASSSKERYENIIEELEKKVAKEEEERKEIVEKTKKLRQRQLQKIQQLQQNVQHLQLEIKQNQQEHQKEVQQQQQEMERQQQEMQRQQQEMQQQQQEIQRQQQEVQQQEQEVQQLQSALKASRDEVMRLLSTPTSVDVSIEKIPKAAVSTVASTESPSTVSTNVPTAVSIDPSTDVAGTVSSDVPTIVSTNVPGTVSTDAPTIVSTDVLETVSTDVPAIVSTDVPETVITVSTDVPVAVSTDASIDVRTTISPEVPINVSTDASLAISMDTQVAVSADVPATVSTEVPSVSTVSPTSVSANDMTVPTSTESALTTTESDQISTESSLTTAEGTLTSTDRSLTSAEGTLTSAEGTLTSTESTPTSDESSPTSAESSPTSAESTLTTDYISLPDANNSATISENPLTDTENLVSSTESPSINTGFPLISAKIPEEELKPQTSSDGNVLNRDATVENNITELSQDEHVILPPVLESLPAGEITELDKQVKLETDILITTAEQNVEFRHEEDAAEVEAETTHEPRTEESEVVPITEETVHEFDQAVPITEDISPETDEAVLECVNVVQVIDELVLRVDDIVPDIDDVVLKMDDTVPEIDTLKSEISKVVQEIDEAVPESNEAVLRIESAVSEIDEVGQTNEETVQETDKAVHDIDEPEAEIAEVETEVVNTVLVFEEVQQTEDDVLEIKNNLPEMEDTALKTEEIAPEIGEIASEIGEIAPEIIITVSQDKETPLQIGDTVLENVDLVPGFEDPLQQFRDTVPENVDSGLEITDTVPEIDDTVPEPKDAVPEIDDSVPAIPGTVPETQDISPETQHIELETKDSAQEVEQIIPQVDDTLPLASSVESEQFSTPQSHHTSEEDVVEKDGHIQLQSEHESSTDLDKAVIEQSNLEIVDASKSVEELKVHLLTPQEIEIEQLPVEDNTKVLRDDGKEAIVDECVPSNAESSSSKSTIEPVKSDTSTEFSLKEETGLRISPPPFDDDDKDTDDDSPLFGHDSTVFDTFGPDLTPNLFADVPDVGPVTRPGVSASNGKEDTSQKLHSDTDKEPKPRASLFLDDDDDDDLDWLS